MYVKPAQADLPILPTNLPLAYLVLSGSVFIQVGQWLFKVEALIKKGCVMRLKGVDLGLLSLWLKKQSFINFGIHATVMYAT